MADRPGRALVAGATGYLGGYVVRELARRGWSVRALVRDPRGLGSLADVVDDVAVADLARGAPGGACDGIDAVFSSVGLTRKQPGRTFADVDHRGNLHLLHAARAAGVGRFVYVSSLDGRRHRHLEIVRAHEAFAADLARSGVPHAVVRPTGYFSDMGEILKMARGGRVYLFGGGQSRLNPIHGADLAAVCADAMVGGPSDVDVGGPEVLTYRQIAEAAFSALGRQPRITSVPVWMARVAVKNVRLVSRHTGDVLAFLTATTSTDLVGPATGRERLRDYFARLARSGAAAERAQDAPTRAA